MAKRIEGRLPLCGGCGTHFRPQRDVPLCEPCYRFNTEAAPKVRAAGKRGFCHTNPDEFQARWDEYLAVNP